MKINKFVEDLKAKSAAELNEELVAAKKELFNLRFQNATNQLDNIFANLFDSACIVQLIGCILESQVKEFLLSSY